MAAETFVLVVLSLVLATFLELAWILSPRPPAADDGRDVRDVEADRPGPRPGPGCE